VATLCSASCSNGTCAVNACGGDGKWYRAFMTPFCFEGHCPSKC
jgi:hypothetical protein